MNIFQKPIGSLIYMPNHFAETLQFEDFAVNFFSSFLLRAYFCERNSELVLKTFFMNDEKKIKKHFVERSFSGFKGAPFKPFEHTMTFFRKMFLIFF